jgi:hypothetical protein
MSDKTSTLTPAQSFQRSELGSFWVEAPERVAFQDQRRGDVNQIVGAETTALPSRSEASSTALGTRSSSRTVNVFMADNLSAFGPTGKPAETPTGFVMSTVRSSRSQLLKNPGFTVHPPQYRCPISVAISPRGSRKSSETRLRSYGGRAVARSRCRWAPGRTRRPTLLVGIRNQAPPGGKRSFQ